MNGAPTPWQRLCEESASLSFVDWSLRGIGQVLFQDDAMLGLLFFIAIGWGAFALGVPQVAIGGLVAVLVAIGAVFRPLGWSSTGYALLAAVFTVLAQGAMVAVITPVGVPTLTASFVLVTWLFLLPRLDQAGAKDSASS